MKAIRYGNALKQSRLLQKGGSYGMAGGLGAGGLPKLKPSDDAARRAREEPSEEQMLENLRD